MLGKKTHKTFDIFIHFDENWSYLMRVQTENIKTVLKKNYFKNSINKLLWVYDEQKYKRKKHEGLLDVLENTRNFQIFNILL